MPTSATLFHELFHLVVGVDNTYPEDGEVYEITEFGRMDPSDAVVNPETYTVMSVAYYFKLNPRLEGRRRADGHNIEFYAYFTTQG